MHVALVQILFMQVIYEQIVINILFLFSRKGKPRSRRKTKYLRNSNNFI